MKVLKRKGTWRVVRLSAQYFVLQERGPCYECGEQTWAYSCARFSYKAAIEKFKSLTSTKKAARGVKAFGISLLLWVSLTGSLLAAPFTPSGIVVHHTATPQGQEYTYEQCRADHVGGRGWDDCGYHFIIQPSGRVEIGRMLDIQGAHCGPKCNPRNIGIAFATTGTATAKQLDSFLMLRVLLESESGPLKVTPHKYYKNTRCPGDIFNQLKRGDYV